MTKCSVAPRSCKLGTSFLYKMLVSIKHFQNFGKGATLDEIADYMEQTYSLSGDIRSQLEHALCLAVESRLVARRTKYYSLICPAANIHLIPFPCLKAKLQEINNSFNTLIPFKKKQNKCGCFKRNRRVKYQRNCKKRIPEEPSCKCADNQLLDDPAEEDLECPTPSKCYMVESNYDTPSDTLSDSSDSDHSGS